MARFTFSHSSVVCLGLWRSWERASMAWKRSSVRSRPGPPTSTLCPPFTSCKAKAAKGSTSAAPTQPEVRLAEHQRGQTHLNPLRGPWTLVYQEQFDTLAEARRRERQLKSWKSHRSIQEFDKRLDEAKPSAPRPRRGGRRFDPDQVTNFSTIHVSCSTPCRHW